MTSEQVCDRCPHYTGMPSPRGTGCPGVETCVKIAAAREEPITLITLSPMIIRIRIKLTHVTIRVNGGPKQRYVSAIHALHVIRVAVVSEGRMIEDTEKTRDALTRLITRARDELNAAIDDVDEGYLDESPA